MMNSFLFFTTARGSTTFIFLRACCGSLVIVYLSLASSYVEAKDFGKMGHTFEIKEEGFLAMIHRKLKNLDIEKEQKKMTDHTRARIEEPDPIIGISKAKAHKHFTFDPTYTLEKDIILPCGKLLYAAGTMVNPLEKMDFDRKLYFIDGRDKTQLKWLRAQLKEAGSYPLEQRKEKKIILTGGRPIELAGDLGMEIYFDQFGELTNKFGIAHVPATVEHMRGELVLQISEVYIDG
jgi:conjugal transfer pilus assembly protein TraW